jgi:histidinol-phosphate phosphatase family protein
VILAGGRGTRLHPLTLTVPKPMLRFHGTPFLEYLLRMVKAQGFEKALLLLGYLPDQVQAYFGDGSAVGIRVECSVTDVDDDTGTRLRKAESLLDPSFLLMYCDNYWPMRIERMWRHFLERRADAQITVYTNKDGYSRSNVRVGADGMVQAYDKSRTMPDLQGVDIGFALLRREALGLLPPGNRNLETCVYPALASRGRLAAYLTDHRYYSVGDHARLPLTEAFLAGQRAVILDRDGVLNSRPPKAAYVTKPSEFRWLPGAIEAVRLLKAAGYRVFVVTNQAGIARGCMTRSDVDAVHAAMERDLAGERAEGCMIDAIRICPHGWDEGCDCRKPKPGMLFSLQREFHLDLTRVPFIGDDERDAEAGEAAGCPVYLVDERRPLLAVVRELIGDSAEESAPPPCGSDGRECSRELVSQGE